MAGALNHANGSDAMKTHALTSLRRLVASCLMLALAGCANAPLMGSDSGPATNSFSGLELLGQTELPAGSKIIAGQSLIIGAGDNWVGKVVLDAGQDAASSYAFFLQALPGKGWNLLSAIRGQRSILVFNKADRTVTIDIAEGMALSNAKIELTMAPRNAMVITPKKP
jgi:hypothetical protein